MLLPNTGHWINRSRSSITPVKLRVKAAWITFGGCLAVHRASYNSHRKQEFTDNIWTVWQQLTPVLLRLDTSYPPDFWPQERSLPLVGCQSYRSPGGSIFCPRRWDCFMVRIDEVFCLMFNAVEVFISTSLNDLLLSSGVGILYIHVTHSEIILFF